MVKGCETPIYTNRDFAKISGFSTILIVNRQTIYKNQFGFVKCILAMQMPMIHNKQPCNISSYNSTWQLTAQHLYNGHLPMYLKIYCLALLAWRYSIFSM